MLNQAVKRFVTPLKPWLRRRLGDQYDVWANWAQERVQRLERRSGHFAGVRYVWTMPCHSCLELFELVGPAEGEVLIETVASGVSPGTEVANFGVMPNTSPVFPSCPGYSAVGRVLSVGKGVTEFRAGDLVATQSPHASLGIARASEIAKAPDGLGNALSLHTMAWIAWHGVHLAGIQQGSKVAVLGRGMIGQLCCQIARAKRPALLVSVARSHQFETDSLRRFCDSIIALDDSDEWRSVQADVTFEVTGSPSALQTAIDLTRDGGRVVLLGSSRGTTESVDFAKIAERRIELVGAHTASMRSCAIPGVYDPKFVAEQIMAAAGSGILDMAGLAEREISPEEAPQLFLEMADGRYKALGLIIDWTRLPKVSRSRRVPFFSRPRRLAVPAVRPLTSEVSGEQTAPRPNVVIANPEVGVAVIGCGVQGKLNAQDVVDAAGCRLVGVMDTQETLARGLSEAMKVRMWTDYESVISDPDVQAVFLSTPHHLHRPQAVMAAQMGKHVLVEKPLAASYADAEALVRDVDAAGVQLGTWLGYRYTSHIVEARRLIEAGAIGTLRGAELSYQFFKPPSYYRTSGWRARRDTAGGGALIMNGIHFLDALLLLADTKPVEVSASYSSLAEPTSEVEDSLAMWIRFEDGALATVNVSSCSMGMAPHGPQFRLYGQDGSLSLGRPDQIYTVRSGLGYDCGVWQPLSPVPAMKPMGVEMVERFASGVRSGSMEVSGTDGLRVQSVIEAAYRSQDLGRPVKLSEFVGGGS